MRLHRDVQERRLPLAGGGVAKPCHMPPLAAPCGGAARAVVQLAATNTSTELAKR